MARTPEQLTAVRKARYACAQKLRRMGYRFAKESATEAEIVAAIHRSTGWPRPERGEAIDYLQRFASMPDGVPTPSRQHDALHAAEYQPDRWLRAAAERAATVQRPLIPAVSRIPGATQEHAA
ncbi:hypothetical protein [Achromobacter sp. 2789STDY5608621]|uniref:hypothetical protein n=1 Tax=Achromobacter sp. 2789STDY5608621 TaxID=1806496 RepID=UPI0006C3F6FC|nr:hypothetical protein [Achromobacter sp. 2789STDY5608621]CUJ69944.1 Uncharacterised protein [Achromobacter sp. 2789STDY5608621]